MSCTIVNFKNSFVRESLFVGSVIKVVSNELSCVFNYLIPLFKDDPRAVIILEGLVWQNFFVQYSDKCSGGSSIRFNGLVNSPK